MTSPDVNKNYTFDPSQFTASSAHLYALYDFVAGNDPLAYFDEMSGGDQTIAMITYNVVDPLGNVTTKFMPGQTTFDPVSLLRAMDSFSKDMKDKFVSSVLGRLKMVRSNYSVLMLVPDEKGKPQPVVWWHLTNAIPSKIDGFSFNDMVEAYYTDFEITLQPESIFIQFEPIGNDPILY